MENMLELELEIDKRVKFIEKYLAIGESHMVDFFVSDHWNTLVAPQVRERLLEFDESDLYSAKTLFKKVKLQKRTISKPDAATHTILNLEDYFNEAEECAIGNSTFSITPDAIKQILCIENNSTDECGESTKILSPLINTKEYMCNKKSHEVGLMSDIVNLMCKNLELNDVLDIGSGKGYLGTHLSLSYGLKVVGVDCSESNSANALSRSQKFVKYWNAHLKNKTTTQFKPTDMNYKPVTKLVNENIDIESLLIREDGDVDSCKKLMLTGLHACGDLSSVALRTFVSTPEIQAMCVIGCCYHQLSSKEDSEVENGFPMSNYLKQKGFCLGRNTRMLGLKSLDRIQSTDALITEEKSTRSLFYRAILSVILEKESGLNSEFNDLRVGKTYAKSRNFIHYVRLSMKRLGISSEKIETITDETISSYLEAKESLKKTLLGFNMLREAYGPAVEALILLDKLLYLKEKNSDLPIESYLIKLFDPVQSPRCFALVAIKR